MTQIFQAMGLGAAGGIHNGQQALATQGPAGNLTGIGEEVAKFAEQLGLAIDQLSPEVVDALEAWLLGGIALPPVAENLPLEGGRLPPGQGFQQLLAGSMGVNGRLAGLLDGSVARHSPESPDLPGKSLLAGSVQAILGQSSGLLDGELAQSFDPEMSAVKSLKDSVFRLAPGAAQEPQSLSLGQTLSAGLEGVRPVVQQAFSPLLANNLLSMNVPQKVGAADWGQAVGERLMWMVKGDQQMAELKITPPNLGPLEVKLTISNDQASVAFLSNHAAVRDALEAAIPRLREMLAQESLQLANVDVGSGREQAHSHSDKSGQRGRGDGGTAAEDSAGQISDQNHELVSTEAGVGLVDMFV